MDDKKFEQYVKFYIKMKPFPPFEKMKDKELERRLASLEELGKELVKRLKAIKDKSKSPMNKELSDLISDCEKRIETVEKEIKNRKSAK